MRKKRNPSKNKMKNKNRKKIKKQFKKKSKEKKNKTKQTIMRIYDDNKIYMNTCLANFLVFLQTYLVTA